MKTSQNITHNTYISLMAECRQAGITLAKACRLADVDYSSVRRWRDKEPKTITTLTKLREVISNHKTHTHEKA